MCADPGVCADRGMCADGGVCVCADRGVCADHGTRVLVGVGSSGGAARALPAQVNASDFLPCEGCSLCFRP